MGLGLGFRVSKLHSTRLYRTRLPSRTLWPFLLLGFPSQNQVVGKRTLSFNWATGTPREFCKSKKSAQGSSEDGGYGATAKALTAPLCSVEQPGRA